MWLRISLPGFSPGGISMGAGGAESRADGRSGAQARTSRRPTLLIRKRISSRARRSSSFIAPIATALMERAAAEPT